MERDSGAAPQEPAPLLDLPLRRLPTQNHGFQLQHIRFRSDEDSACLLKFEGEANLGTEDSRMQQPCKVGSFVQCSTKQNYILLPERPQFSRVPSPTPKTARQHSYLARRCAPCPRGSACRTSGSCLCCPCYPSCHCAGPCCRGLISATPITVFASALEYFIPHTRKTSPEYDAKVE